MRLSSNPYDWQKINPDLFYGRFDLLNRLVERLISGESFGITGGRRMGKTTLLRRLEKELKIQSDEKRTGGLLIVPIYIDTRSIPIMQSIDDIYRYIAIRLKEALLTQIQSDSYSVDAFNFNKYLEAVIKKINDCFYPRIIFIFDEIEPIIKAEWGLSFFSYWRSLITNQPNISDYISVIFAGSSEMSELSKDIGSPLANVITNLDLTLFSQDDTAKLISEPIQYYWTQEFIGDIYQLTGGHPFLIQYIMKIVCNNEVEDYLISLEKAKNQFFHEHRIEFQKWWERFDNPTRLIYTFLVENPEKERKIINQTFHKLAERGLSTLSHSGVIYIDLDTDKITIAGFMFKEWFSQFGIGTIERIPSLADEVDHLLKEVERKLRGLLTDYFDKQDPNLLQNKYFHNKPNEWKTILTKAKQNDDAILSNERVLKSVDIGVLFDLILKNWNDFYGNFSNLSRDKKIAKSRFEERKDHIVFVRNPLRHVNEDDLTDEQLFKAKIFCKEILNAISRDE